MSQYKYHNRRRRIQSPPRAKPSRIQKMVESPKFVFRKETDIQKYEPLACILGPSSFIITAQANGGYY